LLLKKIENRHAPLYQKSCDANKSKIGSTAAKASGRQDFAFIREAF